MSHLGPSLQPERMDDWPLWRLLVLLDDVEREFGAACSTARVLSRVVRDRLRGGRPLDAHGQERRGRIGDPRPGPEP